jgi:hypothetical protein
MVLLVRQKALRRSELDPGDPQRPAFQMHHSSIATPSVRRVLANLDSGDLEVRCMGGVGWGFAL